MQMNYSTILNLLLRSIFNTILVCINKQIKESMLMAVTKKKIVKLPAMTRPGLVLALINPWSFVKQTRLDLGITPNELSDESGIPLSTIHAYLNGTRKSPRVDQLSAMTIAMLKARKEIR